MSVTGPVERLLCTCEHPRYNHLDGKYACLVLRNGKPCDCIGFSSQQVSDEKLEERLKNPWIGKRKSVETEGGASNGRVPQTRPAEAAVPPSATSEHWKPPLPKTLEPKPTGHTKECEDSDLNVCICGYTKPEPVKKQGLDAWT